MVQASKWAATGPDWYRDALCKNTNSDLFTPAIETPAALAEIKSEYCDHCPARDRCLQFAIINGDRGFWGGTSTSERAAMRRVRTRAKCPISSCKGREVVLVETYQICLRCGASWQVDHQENTVPA